jgi:hypothetical protein
MLSEAGNPIFKEPFALRVRIPMQTDGEEPSVIATQVAASTVGSAGEAVIWVQFVLRILFKGAMAELLGMLGFLQLVVYLPLVSVKFPPTALLLYNQLIQIITFDLLPTDDFYPLIFAFPEATNLNVPFADFDFGRFFIMNMGSLFIVIIVTLLQFPIYYIAKAVGCKKVQNYYAESQFWTTPLDVIMGSYIEIVFACCINYLMFTTQGDTHNYGVLINNICMVLATILLIVYPFWLYFFLKKNYYSLQFKEYKDKYGNCYENIQLFDNEAAIGVPILYCLRRALLAIICTFLIGYPVF